VLRRLLGHIGINPDRLRLDWVSAAEGPKFAKVTKEFLETIRQIGPLSEEVPV